MMIPLILSMYYGVSKEAGMLNKILYIYW